MIVFTLKEINLIDAAIYRHGDEHERTVWRDWKINHSRITVGPRDVPDDNVERVPSYVAEVLVAALSRLEKALETRVISRETSNEDAADLCNDIVEIQLTAQAIRDAA